MSQPQEQPKKKGGNPAFYKGMPALNPSGRPPADKSEKPTNRVLRQKAFLEVVRKLRPITGKAVAEAARILNKQDAADQNKLKAAALLLGEYRTLLKELYDVRYDEDEGSPIQEENKPVLSLTVINGDKSKEDIGE